MFYGNRHLFDNYGFSATVIADSECNGRYDAGFLYTYRKLTVQVTTPSPRGAGSQWEDDKHSTVEVVLRRRYGWTDN